MTPTGPPNPITIGDLRNNLAALSDWIDAVRTVINSIRPHDFLMVPPPSWTPGGPGPTPPYAVPHCDLSHIVNRREVRASEIADVLNALRNWSASMGDTLDGLPQDMEIPPAGPGVANS